jgi:hypothetical protein
VLVDINKLRINYNNWMSGAQRIGSTTEDIDINKLIEVCVDLNSRYETIKLILQNKIPLINEHSEIFNFEKELECITSLIDQPRNSHFLVLKSCNFSVPKPCSRDIQVEPATIPELIKNPPKYNFGNIFYSEGEQRPICKYQYIYNFEVQSCRQLIKNTE